MTIRDLLDDMAEALRDARACDNDRNLHCPRCRWEVVEDDCVAALRAERARLLARHARLRACEKCRGSGEVRRFDEASAEWRPTACDCLRDEPGEAPAR